MSAATDRESAPAPSLARLAKTTAVALVAAGLLLVTIVLPAEYAIDPLGTGRRLGLTEIASPSLRPEDDAAPEGLPLAPAQKGPVGEYPAEFAVDTFEIALQPYDYVEYKYRLEKGATMLYAWTATAALMQDFHGERAGAPSDGPEEESFAKDDRRRASGSFTAPFAGIHGWYWENPGGETIAIRLTSSGFYSSAVEIRSDRTRHTKAFRKPAEAQRSPGEAK